MLTVRQTKRAVRFHLALRISLLAAALLAALVWILRLLARRLMRVLAGLSGLIALSILLTIFVGIILFVTASAQWSGTYNNRACGSSFRQIKKKAVQFKCGRPLANKRHGVRLQIPGRSEPRENPRREPAGFAMPFRSHPTLKFSAEVFPLLGTSS